ncbi:cobalamin biosynthesis protein [Marinobacter fonticola]|uniref:cobalamin biosynthesis protein n=1 Tax=Marinobacter fonticola TaxID=2603215 RepID=UPI0011E6E59C|nr:cobalamin biosynthesis protein [Marinobacter fonticola]
MKMAGFGYRRAASLASLADALDLAIQAYGNVDCLAASAAKSACVKALGKHRNLPVEMVDESALSSVTTLTQSQASLREKGIGSVAEATALAAAGRGAQLLGPRVISADRMATCAVAEGNAI